VYFNNSKHNKLLIFTLGYIFSVFRRCFLRSLFFVFICYFFILQPVNAVEIVKSLKSTVYHAQNFMNERVIHSLKPLTQVTLQNDVDNPTFKVSCEKGYEYISLSISIDSINPQLSGKTMSAKVKYGGREFLLKVFAQINDKGAAEVILYNKNIEDEVKSTTIEAFKTLYAIADKGMSGEMQITLNNKTSTINLSGMSNVSNIYESKCEDYQNN